MRPTNLFRAIAPVGVVLFLGAVVAIPTLSDGAEPDIGNPMVRGTCIDVSVGGSVTTSITASDLRAAGIALGDEIRVDLGSQVLVMPLDYVDRQIAGTEQFAYLLWGDLHLQQWAGGFATTYGIAPGTAIGVSLSRADAYPDPMEDVDPYWEAFTIDEAAFPEPVTPAAGGALSLAVVKSDLVNADGDVVALRGAAVEDPYWAFYQGTPVVLRRDLVMIKQWGGNVVHIPVHPSAWETCGGLEYVEEYLDSVIQWAGELGLYAIISWKAHGNPETGVVNEPIYNPDMVLARQALACMAARYQNCPWVLYSVFNECTSQMRWPRFAVCMTALVDAVRDQSSQAVILVPGINVAADLTPIPDNPIPRDNIVYAADVYLWVWEKTPFADDARSLVAAGYPLLVFEWGFDTPEDEAAFPGTCQPATSEEFGEPLLTLCDELGISWTAWVWSDEWCPHMFYDSTRLSRTAFGDLVHDWLSASKRQSDVSFQSPLITVEPPSAASAGCSAVDLLASNHGGIPSTVIEATPVAGWRFDHWEGSVDLPDSALASVELGDEVKVTAVFQSLATDPQSPASNASSPVPVSDFLASLDSDLPRDHETNYARLLEQEELDGAVGGMAWNASGSVDLTCFVDSDVPSNVSGISITLSASEEMTVRIDLASDCDYMSDVVLLVDSEPREYSVPISTFSAPVSRWCPDPQPASQWGPMKRVVVFPDAMSGEIRVHDIALELDEHAAEEERDSHYPWPRRRSDERE